MRITNSLIVSLLALFAFAMQRCEGCTEQTKATPPAIKAINISVFLDLSDRLTTNMLLAQKEADLEIIDHLCDYFRSQSIGNKLLTSKNKMKVIFDPIPKGVSGINAIATNLNIDLAKVSAANRIVTLNGMKQTFRDNLEPLYDNTLNTKNWIGSDIWSFFSSDKVKKQCIAENSRNVIVILTDGFIFHKDSKKKVGNAYSYLLSQTLTNKSPMIVDQSGLEDLEVLVLEVHAENAQRTQNMKKILTDWFTGMGVQHVEIAEADLIPNTKTIIDGFLK